MKLLSIDTSTEYLVIALTSGDKVLSRMNKKAPRSHSSLLMPMIDKVLKSAKTRLSGVDGFCVGVGPGSFTGLRIGVATIKGLCFVTKKPIVRVPTFDAIAYNACKVKGTLCVVLDARKKKVYATFYKSNGNGQIRRISPYLLLPVEELMKKCKDYDNLFFLGDYADKLANVKIATAKWHPRADVIARIAKELYNRKRFVKPHNLEPMYIYSRECDIKGI